MELYLLYAYYRSLTFTSNYFSQSSVADERKSDDNQELIHLPDENY